MRLIPKLIFLCPTLSQWQEMAQLKDALLEIISWQSLTDRCTLLGIGSAKVQC
jgi:hypothetical protein